MVFATAIAFVALAVMALGTSREIDIGLGAPMVVDLVAWYVIGAHLGVLPSLA